MGKPYTSIQVSKKFKKILEDEKKKDESFEDYIKRMREVYVMVKISDANTSVL